MSEKFRQSIISLIWPGPIAGPLPVNLFRILAVFLVSFFNPLVATLVMSILTLIFLVVYFRLLELTGGKQIAEKLLAKLSPRMRAKIEGKGPFFLFATSLLIGVFPYAIFLKLLKYPKITSEILLVAATFASSFIWTGLFWGGIITAFKHLLSFVF